MAYQSHEERGGMIEGGVAVLASMRGGQQPQQTAAVLYYLAEKGALEERGPYFVVGRLCGHDSFLQWEAHTPRKLPGSAQPRQARSPSANKNRSPFATGKEMGMRSKIGAGVVAGLLAGIVFGIMMHLISTPSPMGGRMTMMAMMARVVRSDDLLAGWMYLLVNSVVMGGVFGLVLGDRGSRLGHGLVWGALYGLVLWVLGALVLMPLLLGMEVFAPLTMGPMRHGAWLSLAAHLFSGFLLGGAFALLVRRGAPASRTPRP
jgi:F0F1-type ATP synthase assembly protein I